MQKGYALTLVQRLGREARNLVTFEDIICTNDLDGVAKTVGNTVGEEETYTDTVLLVTPEEMPRERISQYSVEEHAKEFYRSLLRFKEVKDQLADTGIEFGGRVLLIGCVGSDFEAFVHLLARETPLNVVRIRLERLLSISRTAADSMGMLFEFARRNAPSILYLERLESLAEPNSQESVILSLELQKTTWDEDEVIVIASTSKPDQVDVETLSAFDRTYVSESTTIEDRIRMLESVLGGRKDLDPTTIAELTEGWSFQEMKHLAVILVMTEASKEEQVSREKMEETIENSMVVPASRKRALGHLISRVEGRQPPGLDATERVYPDDFLDQLYLMAVGDDYQQTQRVIETLNSGLPLSVQDYEFLGNYPFLLKGSPEDRLTRLLRAKKSNDRLRRIMGR